MHSRRLLASRVSRLGVQNVRICEPRFTAWGTESVKQMKFNIFLSTVTKLLKLECEQKLKVSGWALCVYEQIRELSAFVFSIFDLFYQYLYFKFYSSVYLKL